MMTCFIGRLRKTRFNGELRFVASDQAEAEAFYHAYCRHVLQNEDWPEGFIVEPEMSHSHV